MNECMYLFNFSFLWFPVQEEQILPVVPLQACMEGEGFNFKWLKEFGCGFSCQIFSLVVYRDVTVKKYHVKNNIKRMHNFKWNKMYESFINRIFMFRQPKKWKGQIEIHSKTICGPKDIWFFDFKNYLCLSYELWSISGWGRIEAALHASFSAPKLK